MAVENRGSSRLFRGDGVCSIRLSTPFKDHTARCELYRSMQFFRARKSSLIDHSCFFLFRTQLLCLRQYRQCQSRLLIASRGSVSVA